MISPTPFSLCCAVLLCLPLALVFTTTPSPSTTTTTTTTTTTFPQNPLTNFVLSIQRNHARTRRSKTHVSIPSPPPPPPPPPQDDETLFKLASKMNPNPSPIQSPKKLAFMFLTTSPLPFAPIWELYFNQNKTHFQNHHQHHNLYNIYIHIDPTSPDYNPPFSGVFFNRVIPSKPTKRFTPSLIAAARRLLAHALLHDPANAMFALLSPTCIPLHSFSFTYKTLIRSKKSFIEILKEEPGAYDRWAARGEDVMLPEVPFEEFRIGSQFFVLTRRHARLAVKDDRRLWNKFKLPCVRLDVCYPEEHFFPTLVSMRDPRGCVPATLTHVDWNGSFDGHPRTYEAFEVGPELIYSLRNDTPRYGDDEVAKNVSDTPVRKPQRVDPFLFARKFSPDSLQPLMEIASDVIFRD